MFVAVGIGLVADFVYKRWDLYIPGRRLAGFLSFFQWSFGIKTLFTELVLMAPLFIIGGMGLGFRRGFGLLVLQAAGYLTLQSLVFGEFKPDIQGVSELQDRIRVGLETLKERKETKPVP